MSFIGKIRSTRSNIVGAAYKIVAVEAFQDHELTDAERQALSGSPSWWREHREEVLEVLELIRDAHKVAA